MPKKTGGRWRKCAYCRKKFIQHDARQMYCTRSCRQKAYRDRLRMKADEAIDITFEDVQDVLVDPDVAEYYR